VSETTINHWTKLGSAVRDARARHGWSQHELAERAGVSRSWLARLEAGHRGAELEQILRLLNALDLTLTVTDADERARPASSTDEDRTTKPTGRAAAAARRAGLSALLSAHESTAEARRRAWRHAADRHDRGSEDPAATADASMGDS
jgi:y4mF family transcriptional regulator